MFHWSAMFDEEARKGILSADAPAALVGGELARIEEKRGHLTPAIVIDESREHRAKMRHLFDWDDADKRKTQARMLIRGLDLRLPVGDNERSISAWTQVERDGSKIYVNTIDAILHRETHGRRLNDAADALQAWREKWSTFAAADILKNIDNCIASLRQAATH